MKRFFSFLTRHKKAIAMTVGLIAIGALFRWEVSEIDDGQTGQPITRYRGVVWPWQPCGVRTGGSRLIKFHVRHWCYYGLKVPVNENVVFSIPADGTCLSPVLAAELDRAKI